MAWGKGGAYDEIAITIFIASSSDSLIWINKPLINVHVNGFSGSKGVVLMTWFGFKEEAVLISGWGRAMNGYPAGSDAFSEHGKK